LSLKESPQLYECLVAIARHHNIELTVEKIAEAFKPAIKEVRAKPEPKAPAPKAASVPVAAPVIDPAIEEAAKNKASAEKLIEMKTNARNPDLLKRNLRDYGIKDIVHILEKPAPEFSSTKESRTQLASAIKALAKKLDTRKLSAFNYTDSEIEILTKGGFSL